MTDESCLGKEGGKGITECERAQRHTGLPPVRDFYVVRGEGVRVTRWGIGQGQL